MEVRFGNRKRIRFSDKKHPKHGIISVVLGVLSIIILLTLCIMSGHAKGRAGMVRSVLQRWYLVSLDLCLRFAAIKKKIFTT